MTPADWIQLVSLIVSSIGLIYLVKYVGYTKTIAQQAVTQTEASFKPAIIAIVGEHASAPLGLRNIGKGPALDIKWAITGTEKQGKISYIEAGNAFEALLGPAGIRSLFEGAMESTAVAIRCSYRSISGTTYASLSDYDLKREKFCTTFED